jgi:enoyl-CoA hydratase/carnithine racemase
MSEAVRYEISDRVAIVTIARPDVLNAMNAGVFAGLTDAAARAAADDEIRAVVVTGEGRAFSSGLDVSMFAEGFGTQPGEVDISLLQRAFTVYEDIPKPTIAAVRGPAFGAGLQLAIACDLRVAGADAELSALEVKWGIVPDLGATQRLPRLIGLGRAKEMVMTGCRVPAETSLAWGLVNRVCGTDEVIKQAVDWANELSAGPPLAIAGAKRLAAAAFDRPVRTGLEHEAAVQRTVLASEDFKEAVMARFAKRQPEYRGK